MIIMLALLTNKYIVAGNFVGHDVELAKMILHSAFLTFPEKLAKKNSLCYYKEIIFRGRKTPA